MTRSLISRGALVATFALLAILPGAQPAGAAHVQCGQIITQSTVLDSDVGPCTVGLVIGASNITLNLNGHHVIGTPNPGDGAGIYLLNRTGVTVTNGTVRDFDGGVVIEGGSSNTVSNITARDNIGRGITAFRTLYGDGIAVLSSTNNRIVGNRAVNNGPYAGIGVYSLIDADHQRQTAGVSSGNVIERNTITHNVRARDGGLANPEAAGVRIEPGSERNTVRSNIMSYNGIDGIQVFSGGGNHVIENNNISYNGFIRTAVRSGNGITLFRPQSGNLIRNNLVTNNADSGIWLQGPSATVAGTTANRILNNTAIDNGRGGVATPNANFAPHFDLNDRNPNCDANQWFGNRYRTANPPCTTTGGQQV